MASALALGLQRLLGLTYRVQCPTPSYWERRRAGATERAIYAVWHGDLWHVSLMLRRQGITTMVSTHRDGEIIARVLARQGYRLTRGSSTRGGARALMDFVRIARRGADDLAITVDGPRGPARQLKEGILIAAARARLPIVPVGAAVDRFWRLGSWDRLVIGKPFAQVVIVMGDPIAIPATDRDDLVSRWRPRVERGMADAEATACRLLGLSRA